MIDRLVDAGAPVDRCCRILGVARQNYYKHNRTPTTPRQLRREWLTGLIREVHVASRGTYGYRRIHAELTLGMGLQVCSRTVSVLMTQAGIRGLPGPVRVKRLRGVVTADDLVNRKFHRLRPNEHSVSAIPADIALRAGWALRSTGKGTLPEPLKRRPHFFVEAWRPGHPSKVLLVASKGTHGKSSQVHIQLATATAHVESVHVGAHGAVPFLLVGTEIPAEESLVVHLLEAPAETVLYPSSGEQPADLDLVLEDRNELAEVNLVRERRGERTVSEFQVRPDSFAWFSIVLARAEAATLMAFTGGGKPTAQYLTNEQGRRHFRHDNQAGTGSVRDARLHVHGIDFVGTDHVFRLNGNRVEAFSGIAADLYEHLHHGRVSDYRAAVHALRAKWPVDHTAKGWGPVSIRPDGSIMAMRLLRT